MTANEIVDLITNQGVLLGMLIVVLVYVFKVQKTQTEIIQKNTEATTENAKAIREQMLSVFEQQGIANWKSPDGKVEVTYVAPIDKIIVDSKRLKSDYPQVYDKCQKLSKTKAQLMKTLSGYFV